MQRVIAIKLHQGLPDNQCGHFSGAIDQRGKATRDTRRKAALAAHPGVSAEYETYAGVNDMLVLPVAVNLALQRVFALG